MPQNSVRFVSRQSGFAFFGASASVGALFYFGSIRMIITFCGHSQYTETKQDEQKILDYLEKTVGNSPAELYLGGYGAFDHFALKCGKKYQETHPNTKLIFITPYIDNSYQKRHLENLKNFYNEIIYPDLENVPQRFAISQRNKWMVEKSDCVVAYIDHSFGGAYTTYKYAIKRNKPIFNLTGKSI